MLSLLRSIFKPSEEEAIAKELSESRQSLRYYQSRQEEMDAQIQMFTKRIKRLETMLREPVENHGGSRANRPLSSVN